MSVAWQSWVDGWRRATQVIPSYDHRSVGGGIHCVEWWYTVSDGECALVLQVFSNRYDNIERNEREEPAWGTDLTLHVPWPTGIASIRRGSSGTACEYVETHRCWPSLRGVSVASDLFKAHGADALEQPEAFWDALRAKAVELIAEARERRDRLAGVRQCACCVGRGVTGAEGIEED